MKKMSQSKRRKLIHYVFNVMSRKDKDVSSGDIDSRITSLIEMIDESLMG